METLNMADNATLAPSAEDKKPVPGAEASDTTQGAKPDGATPGTETKDAKLPEPLDIVRDVLKPKEPPSRSEADQEKPAATGEKTDADDVKPDDKKGGADEATDDKPPPFHEHPAWKAQIKKREDAERERDGLKHDADEYRSIRGFMDRHGVTTDQVIGALQTLALLNTDPAKGREALQKSLADLDERLGETLPEDLKKAIEAGEITEDRAKELSRARAKTKIADEDAAARKREDDERQAQDQAQKFRDEVRASVKAWSAVAARTDPDFAKKQPLIQERVGAILRARGKLLQSSEDAVEVTKQAYKDVNERISAFIPKGQKRDFVRADATGTGDGKPAEPKTPLEALNLGLSRSQG
jgi:hypothetical protein